MKKNDIIALLKKNGVEILNEDEFQVNAQHPGAWGPWYHISRYKITDRGTLKFLRRDFDNVGRGDKNYFKLAAVRDIISKSK